MAWTERERDPESFSKVLRVFEGQRYALDLGSSKVLRFMLERPEGCDATLSPDRFEIRFGWHPSRHRYYLSAAPAVVSRILELAEAPPNTQQVQCVIGPATLPQWSFGRRRVWVRMNQDAISIQVRAADGDELGATEPAVFPEPIEFPRQFLDFPSPLSCPHCATAAASYRQLHGGSLACGSCGRSFELSDL
jgi:hypothetical protein